MKRKSIITLIFITICLLVIGTNAQKLGQQGGSKTFNIKNILSQMEVEYNPTGTKGGLKTQSGAVSVKNTSLKMSSPPCWRGGPCCDIFDEYRPSGTVCWMRVEYSCPWGQSCGSDVGKRRVVFLCSGSSPDCDGGISYGPWEVAEDCSNCQACDGFLLTPIFAAV